MATLAVGIAQADQRQRERIAKLLRSDDGKELITKLVDLHQRTSNQLKTARDVIDIHRYQGRLEAYEQILNMKEE
jgi:hypothetical protein